MQLPEMLCCKAFQRHVYCSEKLFLSHATKLAPALVVYKF